MDDEVVQTNVFQSEYANDDFWGKTPYLMGFNDGMAFAFQTVLSTINSGAVPRKDLLERNIEEAKGKFKILEKEILNGEETTS